MDTNSIRELLAQGQTREALDGLLEWVQQNPRYTNNLTQVLQVLQGRYARTRQQEQKGILSFQEAQREYNKMNDTVLSILNDVEAGRMPAMAVRARWMPVFAGVGVLALAAVALWFLFGRNGTVCPDFDEQDALHVLVFPFDALDDNQASVEVRIQDEIRALTTKAKIPAEVEIGTKGERDKSSLGAAEANGQTCGADLVIFGSYKAYEGDSIRVRLGYRFLKKGGQSGDIPFVTYRDITELTAERGLQNALFSVCTAVAINKGNWAFAQRWMGKINDSDAGDRQLAQWMAKEMPK
ncbi:MAG: hypothetical protein JNJ90_16790 [Saprospiraceae bacterium]|jgi:hypothetical protein|nr:hypothetical protein [Saprospiraceae bacterium]